MGEQMKYELWDIAVGVGMAEYTSESEMRELVKLLLNFHGYRHAEDLSLRVEGNGIAQNYTGEELVKWAQME